jgi:tetratricopeptide (TPR) repeat protein
LFLKTALDFFGDDEDRKFAGGSAGAVEKAQRLARIVAARRCLLILDGLEPLQYPPSSTAHLPGTLRDAGVAELLRRLAQQGQGLCVITTRYALPDLQAFHGATVREQRLPRLSREAGVRLLKKLGMRGSELRNLTFRSPDNGKTEQVNEFELLVEDVKGHALTLHLLGSYLRDAYDGDIRRRDQVRLAEADADEQSGHTFRVMDAYVQWLAQGGATAAEQARGQQALALLQLLGLFDRPATADCLHALWQAPVIAGLTDALFTVQENGPGQSQTAQPISASQRNLSLKRLEDAGLLTIIRAADSHELSALDTHPHIREYFAQRLRTQQGEGWRAGQRRVYEHLCATTKEGDEPTLDDLLPLYQAVTHGCQAGLFEEARAEVYRDRILRGTSSGGYYSWKKLGAFGSNLGALACFFETRWSRVAPALSEADQAWLLNETAIQLRALGRLTESLEPMRVSGEMDAKREAWEDAAISYSNLSELELTLGKLAGAVRDAEQSVRFADRSGDAFRRMACRTTHADALHQSGRRAEAETRFREAEQMQAAEQPYYPLLYSLWGFRYCDLLLAQAEQAAWAKAERGTQNAELIAACRAVTERATQTLKWAEQNKASLLSFALDHLTLGRAALFEAPLTQSALHTPQSDIESAVSGLRRAGTQHWLPAALLTRAWLRVLTGARTGPDSAQSDLDEAWEIASRGAMRLHQADIHLYRARLFGLRKADSGSPIAEPYPWQSPEHDLAEAERLINACGYHRRDEELEDAKRAILGQAAM